jgi:hypothetical protein
MKEISNIEETSKSEFTYNNTFETSEYLKLLIQTALPDNLNITDFLRLKILLILRRLIERENKA